MCPRSPFLPYTCLFSSYREWNARWLMWEKKDKTAPKTSITLPGDTSRQTDVSMLFWQMFSVVWQSPTGLSHGSTNHPSGSISMGTTKHKVRGRSVSQGPKSCCAHLESAYIFSSVRFCLIVQGLCSTPGRSNSLFFPQAECHYSSWLSAEASVAHPCS